MHIPPKKFGLTLSGRVIFYTRSFSESWLLVTKQPQSFQCIVFVDVVLLRHILESGDLEL